MERYRKDGGNSYTHVDDDTIVCNTAAEETYMEGIGWFASEIRRKLYFLQINSEAGSGRDVKVTAAKRITYDESELMRLQPGTGTPGMKFYAYGQGSLMGIYEDFAEAVNASYEEMGLVTDEAQRILWNRVDRGASNTIRDPQREAYDIVRNLGEFTEAAQLDNGVALLDARGCILNQVLYFIGQGYPVLAYIENGEYLLLSGFDQYNVTLFNPATGESWKMGLGDGAEYFAGQKNDFICAVNVGD